MAKDTDFGKRCSYHATSTNFAQKAFSPNDKSFHKNNLCKRKLVWYWISSHIGVPQLSYPEKRARKKTPVWGENKKQKCQYPEWYGSPINSVHLQNHLLVEKKDTSRFVPDLVYGHNLGRTLEPMPYLLKPAAAIR